MTWQVADKDIDWVAWRDDQEDHFVCVDMILGNQPWHGPQPQQRQELWRVIHNGEDHNLPTNWEYM